MVLTCSPESCFMRCFINKSILAIVAILSSFLLFVYTFKLHYEKYLCEILNLGRRWRLKVDYILSSCVHFVQQRDTFFVIFAEGSWNHSFCHIASHGYTFSLAIKAIYICYCLIIDGAYTFIVRFSSSSKNVYDTNQIWLASDCKLWPCHDKHVRCNEWICSWKYTFHQVWCNLQKQMNMNFTILWVNGSICAILSCS